MGKNILCLVLIVSLVFGATSTRQTDVMPFAMSDQIAASAYVCYTEEALPAGGEAGASGRTMECCEPNVIDIQGGPAGFEDVLYVKLNKVKSATSCEEYKHTEDMRIEAHSVHPRCQPYIGLPGEEEDFGTCFYVNMKNSQSQYQPDWRCQMNPKDIPQETVGGNLRISSYMVDLHTRLLQMVDGHTGSRLSVMQHNMYSNVRFNAGHFNVTSSRAIFGSRNSAVCNVPWNPPEQSPDSSKLVASVKHGPDDRPMVFCMKTVTDGM